MENVEVYDEEGNYLIVTNTTWKPGKRLVVTVQGVITDPSPDGPRPNHPTP